MTGADLFVRELQARGVSWIATLCGHGLDPLYAACRDAGLRLIDTRNEQAASYMADACGRLTRRPGVVAVSSGIAHVNALAGVTCAYFDHAPLLLVSGSAAVATQGRGHFQDLDQTALARPISKYAALIDRPEAVVPKLNEAWTAATARPGGPVHLTFPMDVQRAEAAPGPAPGAPPRRPPPPLPSLPPAQRPLLVAGSDVFYADQSESLVAFCERNSAPVVVPIWDRGSIDRPLPQFMGVIGAASGGPRLLDDADLVLLCGAAADHRVNYAQDARVVRIEPEHLDQLSLPPATAWLAECQRRRDEFRRNFAASAVRGAAGIHSVDIIAALRQVLADDTVLLIDGGSIGQWCHQLLCDRYPGHWLTCGPSGVVGWGIPGAMAARLCYPDRPVILLSGDGAFTFTPAELECAARQRLPFVALVADDQAWGITALGHKRQFGQPISSGLGPVDFALLAQALGCHGRRLDDPAQIAPAVRRAFDADRPTVLHVPLVGGNEWAS
jgi:acetolactate synthase-1/2/3 large subunit